MGDGQAPALRGSALSDQLEDVPYWFHSLSLPGGVVTSGVKSVQRLDEEWAAFDLPSLEGLTVLDVGACDGGFSFRAESAGAARVVALEEAMWSLARLRILARMVRGEEWRPLSGQLRAAFDVAHAALGSQVGRVEADWMTVDLDSLGRFDIVIFAGVLYHLLDPVLALQRLHATTRRLAVIETHAFVLADQEHLPMWRFALGDEIRGDASNWWIPNQRALVDICRAVGFSEVHVQVGPPHAAPGSALQECRLLVQAIR